MNLGKKEIEIAQVSDFFSQSTGFVLDPDWIRFKICGLSK